MTGFLRSVAKRTIVAHDASTIAVLLFQRHDRFLIMCFIEVWFDHAAEQDIVRKICLSVIH